MNAIKLPVYCYAQGDAEQLWSIRDDCGTRICRDLTKEEANQIAVALNMHDTLVEALKYYAAGTMDSCSDIARAALSKIESVNETK